MDSDMLIAKKPFFYFFRRLLICSFIVLTKISVSRVRAGDPACFRCSRKRGNTGNAGRPLRAGKILQPAGTPISVRGVMPSPAWAAAHRPERLGLVSTTRQG